MIIVILLHKPHQKQRNDRANNHPPPSPTTTSDAAGLKSLHRKVVSPRTIAAPDKMSRSEENWNWQQPLRQERHAGWDFLARCLGCASSTDSRGRAASVWCAERLLCFDFTRGRIKYYISINYSSFKGDNSPCFFFFRQNAPFFSNLSFFFCTAEHHGYTHNTLTHSKQGNCE